MKRRAEQKSNVGNKMQGAREGAAICLQERLPAHKTSKAFRSVAGSLLRCGWCVLCYIRLPVSCTSGGRGVLGFVAGSGRVW